MVSRKISASHGVTVLLGWLVTQIRENWEALARSILTCHCWLLIGIWNVFYISCDCCQGSAYHQYQCIPVYITIQGYLTILGSSMAPRVAVIKKNSRSHDVSFLLSWPVTQGLRDREAFTRPTLIRHCSALIGIWKVHVLIDVCIFGAYWGLSNHAVNALPDWNSLQCKKLNL